MECGGTACPQKCRYNNRGARFLLEIACRWICGRLRPYASRSDGCFHLLVSSSWQQTEESRSSLGLSVASRSFIPQPPAECAENVTSETSSLESPALVDVFHLHKMAPTGDHCPVGVIFKL